jgi:Domain of unknown function (DUF1707)
MIEARHDRPSVATPGSAGPESRPVPTAPGMRASDADRDHTASVLGGALAVGCLTSTEYAERLDAAYAARSLGDLAPLTQDLPESEAGEGGTAIAGRAEVAARFSKVIRSGRWVAGRHTRLTVHFGALIINLSDAVLPGREVTMEIDAFCGKLLLVVPAGAHVIDEGGALFAKRAIYGRDKGNDAQAPVIRLTGDARFSKVTVHRGRVDPFTALQDSIPQWLPVDWLQRR